MKLKLLPALLVITSLASAQSLVQSINSGSIITANSSVSIGEITVVPVNAIQSNSGLIAIAAQINQTLEVSSFAVSDDITVYPNPTVAKIYFNSKQNLSTEKVSLINTSGQVIFQKQIDDQNSLDLTELPVGIYLIKFSNEKLKTFKIIKH